MSEQQLSQFCCCRIRQRIAWHPESQVDGRHGSPFWTARLAAVYWLHAVKPLRLQQLRLHTPRDRQRQAVLSEIEHYGLKLWASMIACHGAFGTKLRSCVPASAAEMVQSPASTSATLERCRFLPALDTCAIRPHAPNVHRFQHQDSRLCAHLAI